MPTSPATSVIEHLRRTLLREGAGLGDGELLGRFLERHDEAALAALVRRHGPMVWGVCRRLLSHHDAEDAFQATFLVLVRKAPSVVPRELVGNWLYGVAHQTALQAHRTAARRKAREVQVTAMPDTEAAQQDQWLDVKPLLDQELSRLPDIYRAVVILCDLEGKTRKEAARQIGVPEGTVAGRLARARAMLAKRLAQRGVALSGGALAAVLSKNAAAAGVPTSVVASTIKAASLFAAGQAAGMISIQVTALTEGVLKAMILSKLKLVTVVLLAVFAIIGSGLLALSRPALAEDSKPEAPKAEAPVKGDVASVSVMAGEVLRIFNANDALGDEKWTGKRLQVTGSMERVRRHGDKYVLTMIDGGDASLWFEFDAKDRKKLAALGDGSYVTIRGQCDGRTTGNLAGKAEQAIRFRNCEIVNAKPDRGRQAGQ